MVRKVNVELGVAGGCGGGPQLLEEVGAGWWWHQGPSLVSPLCCAIHHSHGKGRQLAWLRCILHLIYPGDFLAQILLDLKS